MTRLRERGAVVATQRKCDACGDRKPVKGGKICDKNQHFICVKHAYMNKRCPLDQSTMR